MKFNRKPSGIMVTRILRLRVRQARHIATYGWIWTWGTATNAASNCRIARLSKNKTIARRFRI